MTKKTFSKIIAAVLVVSLCFTAVFTGVVSADEGLTCTVVGSQYDYGDTNSYVTAQVTFESSTAFTAGTFTASAPGLSLTDCEVVTKEGDDANPKLYLNVSANKILFAGFEEDSTNEFRAYTSLTLLLKYTINAGKLETTAKGTSWIVSISGVSVTSEDEKTYASPSVSTTVANSIHVHNYTGETTVNNIKTTTCSVCGKTHTQIVSTNNLEGNDLAENKGAVVTFTDEGDTVLNALVLKSEVDKYAQVYFVYSYKTDAAAMITETSEKLDGTVTKDAQVYYAFPLNKNTGIGRMGRPVVGNFIGIAKTTGAQTISDEITFSIKDYAERIIDGSYTDEQKNFAKSLWNYGKYTAEFIGLQDATDYFSGDAKVVTGNWVGSATAPETTGNDGKWKLKAAKVITGYKPTLKLSFTNSAGTGVPTAIDSITIKVEDNGDLVYHKTIALSVMATENSRKVYYLSDIPTKYLGKDVKITANGSTQETLYGFGRYAQSRINNGSVGSTEKNILQAMMNYSKYIEAMV